MHKLFDRLKQEIHNIKKPKFKYFNPNDPKLVWPEVSGSGVSIQKVSAGDPESVCKLGVGYSDFFKGLCKQLSQDDDSLCLHRDVALELLKYAVKYDVAMAAFKLAQTYELMAEYSPAKKDGYIKLAQRYYHKAANAKEDLYPKLDQEQWKEKAQQECDIRKNISIRP